MAQMWGKYGFKYGKNMGEVWGKYGHISPT